MESPNQTQNPSIKSKIVNICTMVRLRPLLNNQSDFKESINCKDQKTLEIGLSGQIRKQNVQKVFSPSSTQRQIFESIEPFLQKCISGYNVTIFTYGQTGSGKTHTMFGSDWDNIIKNSSFTQNFQKRHQPQQTFLRSVQQDENHSGLIPRAIHYVFNSLIQKRRKYIKIYCSFLQLYNETIFDLLQDDNKKAKQKKMIIHQNQTDGIYIEGLNQILAEDADQCLELMKRGQKNRTVRQTHMNIKSSRSHTIFQLLIEQVFPTQKSYRRMKLNLCDLAGSQKINKAERMQNEHLEQLKNINLSLTTLGKVISSLSQRAKPPFRQSKLTRLLQDSLGGNTYTVIIATITTKSSCLDESLNTLKFLQRAKQIKTKVISKMQISDNPQLGRLQKEICYLKDVLKMKRNGTSVIDVDLNEKYKKLQQENHRLKQIIDEELVQKLKKQNLHLKLKLQRKNNDELSESFLEAYQNKQKQNNISEQAYQKKQKNNNKRLHSLSEYQTLEQKTIQDPIQRELTINQDEVNSQYRKYHQSQNFLRKKPSVSKHTTYGDRSTEITSISRNKNTKTSEFPSLGKKLATQGANKIYQRIQQIEKVKQMNKLKLEKQLELINSNKMNFQSKSSFARVSKYSSKYRY